MPVAALLIYCASLTLTFGVRIALQWRRTGSTGVHGLSAGAGAIEWLAGGVFLTSLVFFSGAASPLLVLLGVLEPIAALNGAVAHVAGMVLAVGGLALTFAAQLAMGDAWRIGVDPQERTGLVTAGPFGLVRNPIYSAMLPTVFGLALMVPTGLAFAVFAALLTALEMQVKLVEEPHLRRIHGREYAAYEARVGRFVPGVARSHAIAACAVALTVAAPAPAARADVIGAFGAFHLRASHGFKVTVLADSRRADGQGEVLIFVTRHRAGASYFAPATVTDSRIEADLGGLGEIDVDFVPNGEVVEERSSCGEGFVQLEDGVYQGTIEFHGEQGFADATASRVRVEAKPFLGLVCLGSGQGASTSNAAPRRSPPAVPSPAAPHFAVRHQCPAAGSARLRLTFRAGRTRR